MLLGALLTMTACTGSPASKDLMSLLGPDPLPASASACQGHIDLTCAEKVAGRVHRPVAWLAGANGDKADGLAVIEGHALEQLGYGGGYLWIYSPPFTPLKQKRHGRHRILHVNGLTARVRSDSANGFADIALCGKRGGYRYELAMITPGGTIQDAEDAWRRVSYAMNLPLPANRH